MEKKDNCDGQRAGARERALRVGGGVRMHTIRRQMYIYLSLIAAGAYFIAESGLEKLHLISEGAAFIMVGTVGLIMSTTTTDIGQSLMLAVREEGKQTRAANRKLAKYMVKVLGSAAREEGKQTRAANRKLAKYMVKVLGSAAREEGKQTRAAISEEGKQTRAAISEEGKQTRAAISEEGKQTRAAIEEIGRRAEERDVRMENRLDRMSAAVESMSNDVKAMSKDNREFFRQMLEAQNRILEKVA